MTFDEIYTDFTKTEYWANMLNTREDSPYHREANVAEHTRMVLAAYKEMFYHSRSPEQRLLTQIAILFHDVGKPKAETPKFSEKRGHYRSYGGHEQISACGFVDYTCKNDIGLNVQQLRIVRWMIENHLPYEKGADKMKAWRIDMTQVLGPYLQCFKDLLLSDAKGRITDDNRFGQSVDWLAENAYHVEVPVREFAKSDYQVAPKVAYVMVGPSGSGKSTFVKDLNSPYLKVFNKDDLRVEFYKARFGKEVDYATAWKWCAHNDGLFNQYITLKFNELIAYGWDIALDNTNLSPKARRQWITVLRRQGYRIVGVEFWSSLQFLVDRGIARDDRDIPYGNLVQQYYSQALVRFDQEVDEVRMIKNG